MKMQKATTLQELLKLLVKVWQFDENAYPKLKDLAGAQVEHFALDHAQKHLVKSVGKIAAALEKVDHGAGLDMRTINEALLKIVVTALRALIRRGFSDEGELLALLSVIAQGHLRDRGDSL